MNISRPALEQAGLAALILALAGCSSVADAVAGAPARSGALAAAQGTALPPPELAAPQAVQPAASPTAGFHPARQRFVWVLPPGLHGKEPWTFMVTMKINGETKYESAINLKAERLAAGSRPEFPAGYEIVRLTDDGAWDRRSAEFDREIEKLIAQYGRGSGEMEMRNDLQLVIDDSHRKAYCVDGQAPDIRLYLDEVGQDLAPMNEVMALVIPIAIANACASAN